MVVSCPEPAAIGTSWGRTGNRAFVVRCALPEAVADDCIRVLLAGQAEELNCLPTMIRERSLKPGEQIPAEPGLCGLPESARPDDPAWYSHLTRVQGKGAFVGRVVLKPQGGLDHLTSVTGMIRSVGAVPSTNASRAVRYSNDDDNASIFRFDLVRKRC